MDRDGMIKFYEDMLLIRRFEETVEKYAKKGHIPGFLHLAIGQEATQAGTMAALKKTDYKFLDHRSHGNCLMAGTAPERVMAEIFGKETGVCQGKGGSMHIADKEVRNFGCNAIQGSTLAAALGTALASQLEGTDDVTAVFFGDGTVGRGEFHESIHMAAIWNLPVIYILVNNQYAISTPASESHPLENLSEMSCAYNIPGNTVDGNDVVLVYEATLEAVERARRGEGPTLLEFKTYRWQGHFAGDPASYRPAEEVEKWKERCPIKIHKQKLLQEEIVSEEDAQEIVDKVNEKIRKMLEFSLDSPLPAPETALKNVYVGREVTS